MPGYDDHAYRKRNDRLKRNGLQVCFLCGTEIDIALDYRDPMSWTADHLEPLSKGGKIMGEVRPAHRRCNSQRQNNPLPSPDGQQWFGPQRKPWQV